MRLALHLHLREPKSGSFVDAGHYLKRTNAGAQNAQKPEQRIVIVCHGRRPIWFARVWLASGGPGFGIGAATPPGESLYAQPRYWHPRQPFGTSPLPNSARTR